jgi:curli biogenesis system outer membrane secretion channel CsgG
MKTYIIGRIICLNLIIFGGLISAALAQTEGNRPGVAVLPFTTAGYANSGAGAELGDLLIEELVNSNRLRMVDKDTAAKVLDDEIKASLEGVVSQATAAIIGQKTGAQFFVFGKVMEFSEEGTSIVIGTSYKATIRFNLRVVHTTTGEIVFSKTFEKTGSGIGAIKNVPGGNPFKSKAMRETIGKAIKEASSVIIEKIGSFTPSPSVAPSTAVASQTVDCPRFVGAKSPRIMVVIPELHISQKIPDPAGETEIIKKLVALKFNVVDQTQIAAIRDSQEVSNAKNNSQAAKALAMRFGADIIIIGEAFSQLATRNANGLLSTRARLEARAIQTDTAKIIAADGKLGSGLDIAEFISAKTALKNAGSEWADYFIKQVCQAPLTNEVASSSAVEITVSNVSFTQLKLFTDQLEKISGVRSIEKKLNNKTAQVDVQFDGNAEKLADAISEAKFGLLRVIVVGLSGNKIEINIGK